MSTTGPGGGALPFVVVGSGFRAGLLLGVAAGLDAVRCVGVVTRTARSTGHPTFTDLRRCLDEVAPAFVLTATPWEVTPRVVEECVARGLPVLAETPPAPDLDGMRRLWAAVGGSGLVQVAEQYLRMPAYAARLALVRSGRLGRPTQVHVSSTQQYHAVAIARGLLGAGRTAVTARASRLVAPLVSPLDRGGWTDDEQERPTATTLATLDLGAGRSALYDFTEGQTRNQLRFRRLLVRGTHGELHDDAVVRLAGPRTLLQERIERRQTGHDVDLGGFDTEHLSVGGELLWRNPYVGRRWMDDEIAMASLLDATASWVRGEGPEPYPLADGLHDHQVALAVEASVAADRPVTTSPEGWSQT